MHLAHEVSRPRENLVAIPLAPVLLSAKCVVEIVPCGREPANVFKCEVRSPSFLSSKFLGCNLQGAARCRLQVCKCFMGKAALKPDHKLHIYKKVLANIHESPWHMILIPAALVCPKTCDTVAKDACNVASHLSIDPTHNK